MFARLHRVRSTGLLYGDLDPGSWYRVERQNARSLWLLTPNGVVDVARQDFELQESTGVAGPSPRSR